MDVVPIRPIGLSRTAGSQVARTPVSTPHLYHAPRIIDSLNSYQSMCALMIGQYSSIKCQATVSLVIMTVVHERTITVFTGGPP